jgi:hypothetical protein
MQPPVDIVEARQQRADRGLAGARRVRRRRRSRRRGSAEVEARQDRTALGIGEADVLVGDVALQASDLDRARPVGDVGFVSRNSSVAPEAGDALRIGLDHRVDLLDRPEEHADQQQEADEAAGVSVAGDHEVGCRPPSPISWVRRMPM